MPFNAAINITETRRLRPKPPWSQEREGRTGGRQRKRSGGLGKKQVDKGKKKNMGEGFKSKKRGNYK